MAASRILTALLLIYSNTGILQSDAQAKTTCYHCFYTRAFDGADDTRLRGYPTYASFLDTDGNVMNRTETVNCINYLASVPTIECDTDCLTYEVLTSPSFGPYTKDLTKVPVQGPGFLHSIVRTCTDGNFTGRPVPRDSCVSEEDFLEAAEATGCRCSKDLCNKRLAIEPQESLCYSCDYETLNGTAVKGNSSCKTLDGSVQKILCPFDCGTFMYKGESYVAAVDEFLPHESFSRVCYGKYYDEIYGVGNGIKPDTCIGDLLKYTGSDFEKKIDREKEKPLEASFCRCSAKNNEKCELKYIGGGSRPTLAVVPMSILLITIALM